MKYILLIIALAGMLLGIYFLQEERPEVRADGYPLNTLTVQPSDHQAPNHNPQQTKNGAELWK